jgi:hypothetical protein
LSYVAFARNNLVSDHTVRQVTLLRWFVLLLILSTSAAMTLLLAQHPILAQSTDPQDPPSQVTTTQPSDPYAGLDDETVQQLLQLMDSAEDAEHQARWADAAGLWGSMAALTPLDEYRYRQAMCLELSGELDAALEIYQELAGSSRPEAARLAAARASLLQRLLHPPEASPPTSEGSLDPHPRPLRLVVQEDQVVLHIDGYAPLEGQLTMAEDGGRFLDSALYPLDPDPTAIGGVTDPTQSEIDAGLDDPAVAILDGRSGQDPGPAEESGLPWVSIGLGSGAVASCTLAIIFGVMADDRAAEERTLDRRGDGVSRSTLEDLQDEGETYATVANVGFAYAGALALGAVIFLVIDLVDSGETTEMSSMEDQAPALSVTADQVVLFTPTLWW